MRRNDFRWQRWPVRNSMIGICKYLVNAGDFFSVSRRHGRRAFANARRPGNIDPERRNDTVLRCLVESIGMIVITVPLLYPILGSYGIDPIWFGVIVVMYVELGQISPPIGINLFVIQSIGDGSWATS